MAYIDDLLGRGEKIRYIGRQHSFVLISSILTELGLIVVLIAAGVVSQRAFGDRVLNGVPVGQLVLLVCAGISAIILVSAFFDYLRWNNDQYVITDQRVIQLRGVVNKEVSDSSLEKINDIELRQNWLGRIFDFGDIEILTASEVGVNRLQRIAHPLDFKRAMLDAKHEYSRGYSYLDSQTVAAYTPQDPQRPLPRTQDIEQTLQKLADLRDQGLLSQAEFEAKKRELLSRI